MKRRLNVWSTLAFIAIGLWELETGTAIAQQQTPGEAAQPSEASSPPFALQYDAHLKIREDRTETQISTKRIKILTPGAIQSLSQQQLQFVAGMQSLETIEAYTEKSDGRRIPVEPANIITRDAASGTQLVYLPDLKQRTIIFPDVGVGDTLVMTHKVEVLQHEFPGHIIDTDVFPRSVPLTSVNITVEAPSSLDINVKATGNATTDKVATIDGIRRHTITMGTQSYKPEEPGAVSALDREPTIIVSTFHSYEELGAAYGTSALPKIKVTPEITSLAADITKNAVGHRAQAEAIDAWVKKNIRYVAVYLSIGRVVPHEAEAILHNKFGDCKDKTTLMAALLSAKGIASEAVLINLGNSYTLFEPATLVALNHAILYLPEFDLYDDPTANGAAFGVLAAEAYDKPVVRISSTGTKLSRTPVMKPEDHVAHATTTVKFAANGIVSGQTQESNTGIFGNTLRSIGGYVQQAGDETIAQRQLQAYNTPGTGHIDLGNSAETVDPATVKGSFTLNGHFKPPAPEGIAIVPIGMPLTARPGNVLLGTRLSGRTSAFVCFAGTQIEDIEATFDAGLPMPIPLAPTSIDNPLFTYRSTFKIENRVLKIHRELVSRVPHQVCPAETEVQISADLDKVRSDVNSGYRFAALKSTAPSAPVAVPKPVDVNIAITADQKRRVDFVYVINLDCSSERYTVTMVEAPQHGKVSIDHTTGKSYFPTSNPRAECNKGQVEGNAVWYEPAAGFTGVDVAMIELTYADGGKARRRYVINVNPAAAAPITPPTPTTAAPPEKEPLQAATLPKSVPPASGPVVEVKRVAIADQPLRVAFLSELNPDCSVVGFPAVRVVEQPKSGKVKIENGTGFPNFRENNLRFKCNSSRSDGTVISYTPNPGYTGEDSLTVEIIYLDGTSSKNHYAIEVK